MRVIGLTGSIAMGKTTAARALAQLGLPVFDSDAAVHALYAEGGAAVTAIEKLVPEAIQHASVDRAALSAAIQRRPEILPKIEAAVHPLVRQAQEQFLDKARQAGADLAVLDIPLLFETGRDRQVDVILVVSAPAHLQRERALARPGMTEEKLDRLLARQMPDAEKRAKAHFIVDSSGSLEAGAQQIARIVAQLRDA
ncbi:MAG: dephospho-CoA kinase [Aestuariivirgaceae bacterium]|nr:dephospho-CoA kinase [Aestuariivirgaceae bacterium]